MQSSTSDLGLGVRLAGDNPHLVGFSNVLHKCKPRGTPGSLLSPACRRHEDSGRIVASLDRKCLGQKAFREFGTSLRGIFDKETYRRITGSSRLTGPSLKLPVVGVPMTSFRCTVLTLPFCRESLCFQNLLGSHVSFG